jgi:uncharacterized protein (DUF362 family)
MPPTVAIVKGERSHSTVQRAVDLSGGVDHLADRPVLIKVNFICTETWDSGATTDPLLVEALIGIIREVNDDITIVESDANMTNADKAARATGMLEMCMQNDVPYVNLIREKERVELFPPDPLVLKSIKVPKIVTESHIVDAAKLKTHSATKVTLGMKNLFGLLPNKWKFRYHRKGISKVIVDICSVISPSLVVVDGFVGMEGKGPVGGNPVKMDLVIAGRDLVETDVVATRVMGFEPEQIGHIRMAVERGLGGWEYEIAGDDLENVRRTFKSP